jgi:2Fe-2S ferredoxin
MKAQCAVTFKINGEEFQIQVENQSSVLELAVDNEIPLNHSCGGFGTCGTCRVFVEKNVEKLPPRENVELEMAEDRGFADHERLSCQIPPLDGLILKVP